MHYFWLVGVLFGLLMMVNETRDWISSKNRARWFWSGENRYSTPGWLCYYVWMWMIVGSVGLMQRDAPKEHVQYQPVTQYSQEEASQRYDEAIQKYNDERQKRIESLRLTFLP